MGGRGLPAGLKPSSIVGGVIASLIAAGLVAGFAWWSASDDSSSDLVGGCPAFNVFAQNQFDPIGTARWQRPSPTSAKSHGFAPNEVVTVDGWVKAQSPYESVNTPPWNADVWFHLADNSGWVTFAGVRAATTVPGPSGNFESGSDPVPLDQSCQGSVRS